MIFMLKSSLAHYDNKFLSKKKITRLVLTTQGISVRCLPSVSIFSSDNFPCKWSGTIDPGEQFSGIF